MEEDDGDPHHIEDNNQVVEQARPGRYHVIHLVGFKHDYSLGNREHGHTGNMVIWGTREHGHMGEHSDMGNMLTGEQGNMFTWGNKGTL